MKFIDSISNFERTLYVVKSTINSPIVTHNYKKKVIDCFSSFGEYCPPIEIFLKQMQIDYPHLQGEKL